MSTPTLAMQPGLPPAVRRVRASFAPVNRSTAMPTAFDASAAASFDLDAPPAPWIDLGWIEDFSRKSLSKISGLATGSPAGAGRRSSATSATSAT